MRKTLVTLSAALLLVAGGLTAWAGSPAARSRDESAPAPAPKTPGDSFKPVFIVCGGSYRQWYGNVETVGRLTNNPDLAKGLEAMLRLATGNRILDGLDKTRPLGALVAVDPDNAKKAVACIYVPVTSLKDLLGGLQSYVQIDKQENGVYQIRPRDPRSPKAGPTYVVQRTTRQGNWALVVHDLKHFALAPNDPTPWLGNLAKEYDLSIQVRLADLPDELRARLAERMAKAEAEMPSLPGESPADRAKRGQVAQLAARMALLASKDLDHVTLGWAMERPAGRTHMDLTVTAKPGTPAAACFGKLDGAQTHFAGFRPADAVLAGGWSCNRSTPKVGMIDLVLDLLDAQAARDLDAKTAAGGGDPKRAEVRKQLAKRSFDVLRGMILGDRVDGAAAVILQPERATLLTAAYVADMTKLEDLLKLLVEAARRKHPEWADRIRLDAAEFQGVRFHTVSIPIPPGARNREQVVRMVGETLDVVVGVGRENVFAAAGRDAMETLKKAIAESNELGPQSVPPMRWTLSASRLAEIGATLGEPKHRAEAQRLASALKKVGDKDHVRLSLGPVERGVRLRVELEEGLIQTTALLRDLALPEESGGEKP